MYRKLLYRINRINYQGLVLESGFFVLVAIFLLNSVSNVYARHKPTPQLFLLDNFDESSDVAGWVMSEKLDGVRAYWDGSQLWTRHGNPINAPSWFLKGLPSFELDGELWSGRGQFEKTLSIVSTQNPDNRWIEITYNIFEVPNQQGNLFQRLLVLQRYMNKYPNPSLNVLEQVVVESNDELGIALNKVLKEGGEGLVVRDPELPYVTGRLSSALKVKMKQDAECRVKDYTKGKGKYQGQVGALLCELLPEQMERLFPKLNRASSSIKIGSGLTDKLRQYPPKIGELVTFQYTGLTKKGLPRFPVFLRVRNND